MNALKVFFKFVNDQLDVGLFLSSYFIVTDIFCIFSFGLRSVFVLALASCLLFFIFFSVIIFLVLYYIKLLLEKIQIVIKQLPYFYPVLSLLLLFFLDL